MKLDIDFGGLGTFRNEVLDLLCLGFVSSLEAWRIVEDKLRVAGKDEWTIDVVDSTQRSENGELNSQSGQLVTSAVGSICHWGLVVVLKEQIGINAPGCYFSHRKCMALQWCCKHASRVLFFLH